MRRKKKSFKRVFRRFGLIALLLIAAIGFAHYQTHDWFREGAFYGTDFPAPSLPLEPSDRMDLYRFGHRRYELTTWSGDGQTLFALSKPGEKPLWIKAANAEFGQITLPHTREEMSWWGWRIPLSAEDGDGTLFIGPLGGMRYYFRSTRTRQDESPG